MEKQRTSIKRPKDPKNLGNEPMFQNEILEQLTVTSPLFAFLAYLPVSGIPAWISISHSYLIGIPLNIAWWLIGIFSFTLAEYLIHRYLYHFVLRNKFLKRVQFLFHGFHHKHPEDKRHLFMPYISGWIIMTLVFGLFYLVLGYYAFMFYSGFIGGYLSYIFFHYCIHRFNPPFNWLKPWWTHHLLHHYGNPQHSYAVQFILWDKLFGTMPPKLSKEEEIELLSRK